MSGVSRPVVFWGAVKRARRENDGNCIPRRLRLTTAFAAASARPWSCAAPPHTSDIAVASVVLW